jgi:4-cresol dehydrogenase (hydroxylating) flavoprotein subunit
MTAIDRRAVLGLSVVAAASALVPGIAQAFAGAALPPGLSRRRFDRALAELRAIVGNDWVFADADSIRPYEKCLIPDPTHRHVPCGAVAPASAEDVQAIVRVASRYGLPLWPISTGKNMGYGSATPATPGQMILDLKRMNRIIHVDAELATALVEPGVTYQQLTDYLAEHGIPLWVDVPTVGPIVGPVGNTLDRGVGYTPYGDHFMFQCGMEVVLASGEILRTGMGSLPNSSTWQAFKWGYGPYLDGIFTQSNFGVVTKMGLWLMPKPPVYKPFMVRHSKSDDIARLVDAMRPLRISQLIPNCVLMMGAAYQLAMFKRRGEVWTGEGPVPDEALAKAARANELGMWNSYFALYGTEEMVAAIEPVVRAGLTASGGDVLTEREMSGNPWFEHHRALMRGGLNLDEIGLARWRGAGGGLAWFAPVAPAKGAETRAQAELAREILGKHGFDYTAAWVIGWRELHHICALLYDRSNAEEHARADVCYRELVVRFAERGWGSYRTGVAYMDLVASQFGDVNRRVNATLKRALDPAGILAPGKSGIV